MWPFRRRRRKAFLPGFGYVDVLTTENAPVQSYVNLLLLTMANSEQRERTLRASVALPPVECPDPLEMPAFPAVANRLKVMANLNPVLYPEPKEASLPIKVRIKAADKMHDFTVHLLFRDQGDREVRIRLEDHGPSPERNQ